MNLKGKIEDFFMANILQLLYFEKKTGVLQLATRQKKAEVFFQEGFVINATASRNDLLYSNLLIKEKVITQEQIEDWNKLAKKTGEALETVLMGNNIITPQQFMTFRRTHVENIIHSLFRWETGTFAFVERTSLDDFLNIEIDTMEIILEISRRVDEMSVFYTHVPNDTVVFRVCDEMVKSDTTVLKADEWQVLSFIDGNRSVGQIITMSATDEFSIYKILYSLVSSGLIEQCGEALPVDEDRGKKKTILIADDMKQIRNILRFSLRQAGYNVLAAENGEQALEVAFGEIKPDLIILDIMMPIKNGYQVIHDLRQNDATRYIPVIFLTAQAQKQNIMKGIQAGGNDYVVKPYKFTELHKKVARLLGEDEVEDNI